MEVEVQDIMALIRDILESIDNTENNQPIQVTQFSDEILTVEFGDKRFRIEVKDLTRFQ